MDQPSFLAGFCLKAVVKDGFKTFLYIVVIGDINGSPGCS
jgi:hypothetical protein